MAHNNFGVNGPREKLSTGRNRDTLVNMMSKQKAPSGVTKRKPMYDRPDLRAALSARKSKPTISRTDIKAKSSPAPKVQTASPNNSSALAAAQKAQLGGIFSLMAAKGAQRPILDMPSIKGQGGTSHQNVALAKKLAIKKYGWTGAQWRALKTLWMNESGFKAGADNPTSTAEGIPQAIMSLHFGGYDSPEAQKYLSSPRYQILWGLRYISQRYKNPIQALKHWMARVPLNGRDVGNWY